MKLFDCGIFFSLCGSTGACERVDEAENGAGPVKPDEVLTVLVLLLLSSCNWFSNGRFKAELLSLVCNSFSFFICTIARLR